MRAHAEVARFCSAHDDLRDYVCTRERINEAVALAEQRWCFQERWDDVWAMLRAAEYRSYH